MKLPAQEFLRRYLQHVLPQGFHKVRYYGFLSPGNRRVLKRLQYLLEERRREKAAKSEATPDPPQAERRCPCCKEGIMVIIGWLPKKARSPRQVKKSHSNLKRRGNKGRKRVSTTEKRRFTIVIYCNPFIKPVLSARLKT